MPMPKKDPMVKSCEACGGMMIQPRWKSGKLDGTFKNRRYCSLRCYGKAQTKAHVQKSSAHRRAQRQIQKVSCNRCGAQKALHCHHKDRNPQNNAPVNIEVLCHRCHEQEHIAAGDWGKGRRLPLKVCPICRKTFRPKKARTLLCGKKACRSQWGRRSAALRWASKTE